MDLNDQIQALAARVVKQLDCIKTEEATRTALVMPFINALGYNVFDPTEVIPGLTADHGIDKGEKVDFAIVKDGKIIMLFECRPCTCNLDECDTSRLDRYFSVVETRIGVLTNGIVYRFFTDVQEPNKMDQKPFLELDLMNLQEPVIAEIEKLTKSGFERLWLHALQQRCDELQRFVETLRERATELQLRVTDLTLEESAKAIQAVSTQQRIDELQQKVEKLQETATELECKVTDLTLKDSLHAIQAEPNKTQERFEELQQRVNELKQRVDTSERRAGELEWKMTDFRLRESFNVIQPETKTIQFLRRGCCSIQLDQVAYEPGGLRLAGYVGNPSSVYLVNVRLKFSARKWASSIDYVHFQSKGVPFLWTPQEIGFARTNDIEIIPPGERRRFEVTIPNVKQTREGIQLYVSLASEHYSWGRSSAQRLAGHEECPRTLVVGNGDSVRQEDSPNDSRQEPNGGQSSPLALVVSFPRIWIDRERESLSKRFAFSA